MIAGVDEGRSWRVRWAAGDWCGRARRRLPWGGARIGGTRRFETVNCCHANVCMTALLRMRSVGPLLSYRLPKLIALGCTLRTSKACAARSRAWQLTWTTCSVMALLFPAWRFPILASGRGDQVCGCVSAAGVLAKVTRDRIMVELDAQWPGYGFAVHKGYVTSMHREALAEFGPSPEHRYSFAPVRAAQQGRLGPTSGKSANDQEGAA